MKIAGLWNGHDCSFCVLEDGVPTIHAELERYSRDKEPKGDSYKLFKDVYKNDEDIKHWVTCSPVEQFWDGAKYTDAVSKEYQDKYREQTKVVGHHQSHAANAFYSSDYDDALVLTIDGGGGEKDGTVTGTTMWKGSGTQLEHIHTFPHTQLNIGSVWTRHTAIVHKLNVGYPYGHQAGSVMAMAAMGDKDRFRQWIDIWEVEQAKAGNAMAPGYFFVDFLYKFLEDAMLSRMSEKDVEQTKFDIAAALQSWTEDYVQELVKIGLEKHKSENLCLSGGVVLNCVAITKIYDWFPEIKNIYTPPVPYDAGLCIGAAQYVYHHELGHPRVDWNGSSPTYLGETYSEKQVKEALDTSPSVLEKIEKLGLELKYESKTDDEVIDLLDKQNIISVFGSGSESGRRALGNRSILADPRSPDMKDMINEKVKHRQWFRPFAPSILREEVKNWFQRDVDSPYMSFCVKFKEDMKDKVPAVLHFDGTARLQSVDKRDNEWYHGFLSKWLKKSGVPILLNTSFNDREPIVETPEHAVNCYLGTNIDYLYFRDYGILVSKRKKA